MILFRNNANPSEKNEMQLTITLHTICTANEEERKKLIFILHKYDKCALDGHKLELVLEFTAPCAVCSSIFETECSSTRAKNEHEFANVNRFKHIRVNEGDKWPSFSSYFLTYSIWFSFANSCSFFGPEQYNIFSVFVCSSIPDGQWFGED